jgi:hypothetical protein
MSNDNLCINYFYNRELFNIFYHEILFKYPYNEKYGSVEVIKPITSIFIRKISDYYFNNTINQDHVESIYNNIIENNKTIIYNPFKVIQCTDEDNKLYLIDGHHRKEALYKIMNNNKHIDIDNININIEIYYVKTKDCIEAHELFKEINNTKPYSIKTNDDIILNIIYILEKNAAFNKGLKTYTNNITNYKGNFPYYSKNYFINQLRDIFKNKTDINPQLIADKIIKFNENCAKLKTSILFNNVNSSNYEKFKKKKQKCINNNGFYLKTDYGSKWIDELI